MIRQALFLDRDGVINIDHGYVHTPDKFEFIDGIFDLVRAANIRGYLVVVVTNQAGIGRGYYSEAQFHSLTNWMKNMFLANGAKIDAVYFSPYHPIHGNGHYRQVTDCRKPNPGMLLRAQTELKIDLKSSVMVGDNLTDIEAGKKAGVALNFLFNSNLTKSEDALNNQNINDLISVIPYL